MSKSIIKNGTRVINCYIMSPDHGKHGTVSNHLFNPHVKGWNRVWSWIQYDDGSQNSEMKKYLKRENEI